MPATTEKSFESVIESHLLANGHVTVEKAGFDSERAVFPEVVLDSIQEAQPKEWAKLEALHGDRTGEQVLTDLCKSVLDNSRYCSRVRRLNVILPPFEGAWP